MIAGLNSSGIAGAIRTAGQARATMDTMARQIATGQRVSSVKDDGAAFARSTALRSEATSQRVLSGSLSLVRQVIDLDLTRVQVGLDQREQARQAALRATDPSLSAAQRVILDTLQEDYFAPVMTSGAIHDTLGLLSTNGSVWHATNTPANNALAIVTDTSGGATTFQGAAALPGLNSTVRSDLSSSAAALIALDNIARVDIPFWQGRQQYWSSVSSGLERRELQAARTADRLDTAAASLTDADLGKASAVRAQAETRQQLALASVRQAINTYGNFASGLLGNVQRTQRGIMA